jgi:hypothetical protein
VLTTGYGQRPGRLWHRVRRPRSTTPEGAARPVAAVLGPEHLTRIRTSRRTCGIQASQTRHKHGALQRRAIPRLGGEPPPLPTPAIRLSRPPLSAVIYRNGGKGRIQRQTTHNAAYVVGVGGKHVSRLAHRSSAPAPTSRRRVRPVPRDTAKSCSGAMTCDSAALGDIFGVFGGGGQGPGGTMEVPTLPVVRRRRDPPAACGHAGLITRRYETAAHKLISRLCRIPCGRPGQPQMPFRSPGDHASVLTSRHAAAASATAVQAMRVIAPAAGLSWLPVWCIAEMA